MFLGLCGLHSVQDTAKDSHRGAQTLQDIQDQGILPSQDQIHPAELPRQTHHGIGPVSKAECEWNQVYLKIAQLKCAKF